MAASTDVTFWAFVWYIMNNPYKKKLTRQDIHEMAEMFAAANQTELSTSDPGGTYGAGAAATNIEWPDKNGGASTITAIGNSSTDRTGNVAWDIVDQASQATLDQAYYPRRHKGS